MATPSPSWGTSGIAMPTNPPITQANWSVVSSLLDQALSRARVNPTSAFGRGGTAPTNPMAGGTSLYDAVFLASNDVLRRSPDGTITG